MPRNPNQTDGNEADSEQEDESERDDASEIYDFDLDDEENATKTEQARRELLGFLRD